MNVDEKEKAALCIAVHHRQYPCFFSIHIHTPFSYPQQEQVGGGGSPNVFESTAMEDFSAKKPVRRYSVAMHALTYANRVSEKEQEGQKMERKGPRWQERCFLDWFFIPNHFDLCETAASLMKKKAEKKNVCDQISSAYMFPLSLLEMYPGALKGI